MALPNLTIQNPETGEHISLQMSIQATDAASATKSEAFAVGERNGVPVESGDPTYQNNAKYYRDQMREIIDEAQTEGYINVVTAVADAYSASKTYNVGEYSIHDGKLYRCVVKITTAEAWTSAHWTQVNVGEDLSKTVWNEVQNLTVAQQSAARNNIKAADEVTVAFHTTQINSLETGKQDKLTFDTAPTAGSSNPVTSAGIKTVTDALAGDVDDLKSAITAIEHGETDITNNISWTANYAIKYNDGGVRSSTAFKLSDYIDVSQYNKITVTVPVFTSSTGTRVDYGCVFFDSARNYLESAYHIELGTNTNKNITIDIPPTAHYIRLTYFDDAYESYTEAVEFECVLIAGNSLDELSDRIDGLDDDIDALNERIDAIKTTVVLGQDEINEFYSITSSGIGTASNWGVTSYIDCYGVSELSIKMPVLASSVSTVVGLDFYDQTKTKLSFVPANRGTNNGAEIRTIDVPDGAYYFRATYWKYENALLYGGDWYCTFKTAQYTKYRPYQSGYIFYSPLVNQSVNQYWETDLDTELGSNMKPTTGVLLLPESYTPTGKPTPIIMYFHGYSHYVYYDNWGEDEAFRTQKAQWAAQGFAVLDCNGARNNDKANHFTSGGSLQYSDGYHKCYEYVKQHYNVEDCCHVICVSAGGIPGINYVYWYNDVKSLQMLSAWTSLRNNSYANGQTASMIEYLGCDFTNGYDATVVDRTIGFDPTLRIMTVDGVKYLPQGKIPMKAFLGSTEENNHIWNALQNYVTALRNAGQSVSLRIVDGATHKNICSDDILALNTEYANFCKSV